MNDSTCNSLSKASLHSTQGNGFPVSLLSSYPLVNITFTLSHTWLSLPPAVRASVSTPSLYSVLCPGRVVSLQVSCPASSPESCQLPAALWPTSRCLPMPISSSPAHLQHTFYIHRHKLLYTATGLFAHYDILTRHQVRFFSLHFWVDLICDSQGPTDPWPNPRPRNKKCLDW